MKNFFGSMDPSYFPCTCACMAQTEQTGRELGLRRITGDDICDGWSDGLFFEKMERTTADGKTNFHVTAGATVIQPAFEMALQIDLYASKNGVISVLREGIPSFSFPPEQTVHTGLVFSVPPQDADSLGFLLTACLIGQDTVMRFKTKILESPSLLQNFSMFSDIHILDPVRQRPLSQTGRKKNDSFTIVCYDRAPAEYDEYDYLLYFKNGGFYIPSRGQAVFADLNQKFLKALSVWEEGSSSDLSLVRRNGGGLSSFENEPGKNFSQFFSLYIDPVTKLPGFQWDFKTARWTNKNPIPAMEILETDYKLTVSYQVAGSEDIYQLTVYSDEPSEGDPGTVSPIRLYWGCLAKDTPVTLADRSQISIQDITAGMSVYSDDGPLMVRTPVSGQELKGIYRLTAGETKDCIRELYLTADHPLITDCGIRVLQHIKPYIDENGRVAFHEKLRTEQGAWLPIRSVELAVIGDRSVYNLELTSSSREEIPPEKAIFYANGLAVGDNRLQAHAAALEFQKKKEAFGLPADWERDVASAQQYFKINDRSVILWKK